MEMSNHRRAQKAVLSVRGPVTHAPTSADADKRTAFAGMTRLLRIWHALPNQKKRRKVDPVLIGPELLPHLCLGHFLGTGTDFRYDLIGAEIARLAPRLAPGSLASDTLRIQGAKHDHILSLFLQAGTSQRPHIHEIRYNSVGGVPLRIFAGFMPLGLNPDRVCAEDLLLAVWRTKVTDVITADSSTDLTGEFMQFSGIRI
tara:strand:- start:2522 stop:3124 length:603 start_codon:yes stop_codon:yes gene_type:complete